MAPNEAPECLADGRKKKNRGGTTSRNTKISAAASKARADTLVAQAKEAKAAAAHKVRVPEMKSQARKATLVFKL